MKSRLLLIAFVGLLCFEGYGQTISAGGIHSLALKEDGTVVVWGSNDTKQCDVSNGLKGVIAVSTWGFHSLALKEDGTVVAWGWNDYKQCDVPNGLKGVIAVSGGAYHSLALKEDGTVVAWGSNDSKQCDVPNGLIVKRSSDAMEINSKPPILSISDIQFIDENGNNTIDAFEENSLTFSLNNTGPGNGYRLIAEVSISGNIQGIDCQETHALETVEPGSSMNYSIPISSSRFTSDGSFIINVKVIEPKGFSPEPFSLEIATRAFRAPKLDVVDFSSSMTPWEPNTPIGLDVLVQNTGEGAAENVKVELKLPNVVNCYSSNLSILVTYLAPGETLPITYDMIVPRNFDQNNVTANLTVTEKFGDYGSTWNHNFPFDGRSNGINVISIEAADGNESIEIGRASLIKSNTKNIDVLPEITFEEADTTYAINAVAVIGKEVTDCNGTSSSAEELAAYTENNILAYYDVIDRRHFEDILNEHRIQMSGFTIEKTLIENGCIENAQGYLFVRSGCLLGDNMIELRLVHCETSNLVWSCTGVNATAQQVLDKVREELGKE